MKIVQYSFIVILLSTAIYAGGEQSVNRGYAYDQYECADDYYKNVPSYNSKVEITCACSLTFYSDHDYNLHQKNCILTKPANTETNNEASSSSDSGDHSEIDSDYISAESLDEEAEDVAQLKANLRKWSTEEKGTDTKSK